uniref:acyltransferase family protein n=1 Tax=uncultured Megasphaera sp. TaxID=165188 RepID=UPI00265D2CB3
MSGRRIIFLDNLKTLVIALVVVFHGAMSYMAYAPEWWYVLDDERSLAATVFVVWADVFIMPVMFFISGYFGAASLAGTGSFWKSKWKRVGLPWLFGSVFIAPYIAYLYMLSRAVPMTFYQFYVEWFWGVFYQQAQYWYLGFLMALYGLLYLSRR